MSEQVLHLDFMRLTPDTGAEQMSRLETVASELRDIEGVQGVGVIEGGPVSDFDLAFWFLLRDFMALEPFGTHQAYTQFLQGSVAPVITAFAGADVRLQADFGSVDGAAACLALMGPEEAYDFEVRDALEAWASQTGASQAVIGLAVGEKQAYRGAAIAFGAGTIGYPIVEPFRATVISGQARSLA